MGSFFAAIGRFIGAVLMLIVLGFVLSLLGCNDSSSPWEPAPDFSSPGGLGSDSLGPDPLAPSLPPPPDIDLTPPAPLAPAQPVELAPVPAAPIPFDPGPP